MQEEKDQSSDQENMMKQISDNTSTNDNNNNKAPQKCPRCESLNTKFCYYNNYSLSQPRYFCKACRRYWTQGGTLRNVPVGGGCRKGKRARTTTNAATSSSSSTTSSSGGAETNNNQRLLISQAQATVVLPQQNQTNPQAVPGSGFMRAVEPAGSFGSQYYPGPGSYLTSFAAINQSFNQGAHHDIDRDRQLNQFGMMSSSTLSLLEGFNIAAFGSQQQQPSHHQFYNPSDHHQTVSSSRPINASTSSHHDHHQWPQSFAALNHNNSDSAAPETTAVWTVGANNSTAGNVHVSTNSGGDVPSLSPNQWPHHQHHDHLAGSYGPPP